MLKPEYELKTVYYIKHLTEDGLLKDFIDSWGDGLFEFYGYDSTEDARVDILKNKHTGNFVIVEVAQLVIKHGF